MLHGELVDIDKAASPRERTVGHELGCDLWRDHMEHVELVGLLALFGLEYRDLPAAIHGLEVGTEIEADAVRVDIFHQRRNVFLDPEQDAAGIMELDVDIFQNAAGAPGIA